MAKESIKHIYQLEAVTHNIANVNTPGFKAEKVLFPEGTSLNRSNDEKPLSVIDYSPGPIQKTGNVFDVAVGGEGFFVIETANGEAYSRDGRFTLNERGELVTHSGDYVLGKSGKIVISGDDVRIDENGSVKADGNEAGVLKIVELDKPEVLKSAGKGLLCDLKKEAGPMIVEKPKVYSEHLEMSNVQAIKEMVNMISIHRSFETYQKTMQILQEQDKLSTNRIGKLV